MHYNEQYDSGEGEVETIGDGVAELFVSFMSATIFTVTAVCIETHAKISAKSQ